jgi:hypothetical protein
MAIVLVLALFPILYLFDTRVAMVALVLAIIGLYRKRTARPR